MTATNNYFKLIEITKTEYENYQSLPMCVYITDIEGRIICANEPALKLFKIEKLSPKDNIGNYYVDVRQRKWLIDKFKLMNDKEWDKNHTLILKIGKDYKSVSFFTQIHKDEKGNLLGLLCLTFKITEFERFRELGQYIPGGFFQISSNQEVIYANNEFKRILGYDPGELELPCPATFFFHEENDFKEIVVKLIESVDEPLVLEKIKLKRKSGSSLLSNIYIVPNHDSEGRLISSKGLIKDITNKYIYDFVPIGLYMLEVKDGEKIITWANKNFNEILSDSTDETETMIGVNVKNLYEDPNDLKKLDQIIEEEEQKGLPLLGYDLKLKNGKRLILNTRQIRNSFGILEARVGAIYDVTENVDRWTSDIKKEIGGFLHTYASMLNFFDKGFLNLAKSTGKGLIESNKFLISHIEKSLNELVYSFQNSMSELLEIDKDKSLFSNLDLKNIKKLLAKVSEKKGKRLKTQAIWFREIVLQLNDYIRKIDNQSFANNFVEEIDNQVGEIVRLSNLASILHTRVEIKTMLKEIDLMKEFIATGDFQYGTKSELSIIELMDEVVDSLGEYSSSQLVEILKIYKKDINPMFYGNKQQLKIALYNVVHNAIKYSFEKYGILAYPYVSISINRELLKGLIITIQNRGLGVEHKLEIENDRIFEFGIRGIHSREMGKLGSGIGLFHTKKVVEFHGGSIEFKSIPIDTNHPKDYKRPFLTTVTITL